MTVHVFITGRVHGVGFRQFIRYNAKKLNISGWITNLPDHRIEAVYIGNDKAVKEMVEISKKGPFLAEVESIEVDWEFKTDTDIIDFQIIK